jgi:hypothetical protein
MHNGWSDSQSGKSIDEGKHDGSLWTSLAATDIVVFETILRCAQVYYR